MFEFLEQQHVSADLIEGLRRFRAAHPTPADQAYRVPVPRIHYRGRDIWEQAATALLCGDNLLLCGPKATGKNVLADDLASAFGRPMWNVSFHIDVDAAYLMGSDTFRNGTVEFRPGPVVSCAQHGGFGVLDEINVARSEALAVLHSTLDYRRIIDVPGFDLVRLDDACRFIGTMNVGYAGTRELNEALASRFVVISMPTLDIDGIERLLADTFPALTRTARHQFALLFDEIRTKCAAGELSDRALDLRGLIDAIELARNGLDIRTALEICIVNKTFDRYERNLAEDVIDARLPRSIAKGALFE